MFYDEDFSDDFTPLVGDEESQRVVLDPDPHQRIRGQAPREYAFDAFIQNQMEGYIRRERQEARIKVSELEEDIAREKEALRVAAEARISRAGAIQSLEASYLKRQQEELERQRDIMLGLRRDQNIRNLKKAKENKRGKRR
jgi:hypothetical protein